MKQYHLHTLDPLIESKSVDNQQSKAPTTLQPCNEQTQEDSDDDIEFQTFEQLTSDNFPSSPPLWRTQRALGNTINQASTPYYDYFGHPFPGSRLQVIKDGRRHLMEMIQDLPDSSFELSLKDIVDDQQSKEECQQAATVEKVRKPQQRKNLKRSQISRSESMDSGVFLLKMFLPASIGSKKKQKPRKCSKVSSKTSVDEPVNRDWWKIMYVVIKENKYSRSIKKSMSANSSSKSRLVESNCRERKQRGCFF